MAQGATQYVGNSPLGRRKVPSYFRICFPVASASPWSGRAYTVLHCPALSFTVLHCPAAALAAALAPAWVAGHGGR